MWSYLYHYALKHQSKEDESGFGLVDPREPKATTRTLSARYYKDGSEVLINQSGIESAYLDDNKPAVIEKNQDTEAFTHTFSDAKKEKNPDCTLEDYKDWMKEAENIR